MQLSSVLQRKLLSASGGNTFNNKNVSKGASYQNLLFWGTYNPTTFFSQCLFVIIFIPLPSLVMKWQHN